ncbi:MAG TPA: glycoside hydrolase family 2 TIM barrel-domain containing protein [Actinomycetota bacterium]|nr:glycoside hydrolase family 2 TIM barrel-domain containing protein [Actinomycetota bacterium]
MRPPHTPLYTAWGEQLDPDRPLPEHPRPQLQRDSFVNLNGRWDYAFRIDDCAPPDWDGTIVVPFSPEAPLSGVGRQLQPGEFLHYRRRLHWPGTATGNRLLLHFGAIDQRCTVNVNGTPAGYHEGGYLPFTIDVTDVVTPGDNDLHVVVSDPSDTGVGARGKQQLRPGGIWYTAQSGIWQTVWLEEVPEVHIGDLILEPDLNGFTVLVRTDSPPQPFTLRVLTGGATVLTKPGSTGSPLRVDLPDPRRWSPEDPHLYDLLVTTGRDVVRSYVGLRTFGIGPDRDGHPRLLLNGRPYFHAGVLDQGYWPDGLYTAPSDEALVYDIQTMKDLGFTMLRKHIKIEPLRWYHHCDRLGMLVWQDMVNGGGPYRRAVIQLPAVSPLRLADRRHRLFGRADPAGRDRWLTEARETVELLRNCPSVAVWVPFNEGWGQFDASTVAEHVRELDPSRPVDHASGWHDQGGGDFRSLHVYFRAFRVPRRPDGRVLALTEYGGYSWRDPGHSATENEFGYRRYGSSAALTGAFVRLHEQQILPAVPRGLSATVYTQLSDVEDETNGLLTYDRRVVKMSAGQVRAVIGRLRIPAG